MPNAISDARTELFDAIKTGVEAPWRIQRTSPEQIAAPMIYIDSPELRAAASGIVTINFPVVIIFDGSVRSQIDGLDQMLAVLWTTATYVGTPTNSRPVNLDVGGPSLRAQVLDVEMFISAVTLCPPTLITAGSN